MKIKVKKLSPYAVLPYRAHSTDAGYDLTAITVDTDKYDNIVYGTGLAFEIPEGYAGFIFPRSSISKTNLSLRNCVGVIDSGYRGEVMAKFSISESEGEIYGVGDRIGQMIIFPIPQVEYEEVLELNDSDRGEGGFGSTGN